ncbi:unnamed protein product [Ectocarpus sp. 4 AP-2014]
MSDYSYATGVSGATRTNSGGTHHFDDHSSKYKNKTGGNTSPISVLGSSLARQLASDNEATVPPHLRAEESAPFAEMPPHSLLSSTSSSCKAEVKVVPASHASARGMQQTLPARRSNGVRGEQQCHDHDDHDHPVARSSDSSVTRAASAAAVAAGAAAARRMEA